MLTTKTLDEVGRLLEPYSQQEVALLHNGNPSSSLDDAVGKGKGRDKPPTTTNSLWLQRRPKTVLTEAEIEAERQEAERQEVRRQEAERQEVRRQEARRQEARIQEAERQEVRRQYIEEQKLRSELLAAERKGRAKATKFVKEEEERIKRVEEKRREIIDRARADAEFEISETKRAEELKNWLNNKHHFIKYNPRLVTNKYINGVLTDIRDNAIDTDLQYLYGTVQRKFNPDEAWKLIKNIIDVSLRSRR